MERGPDRGYFPNPAKSLFVSETPRQEEATRGKFAEEGIELNFVSRSCYIWAYIGPQEELEAWVKPKLEAWVHRFRVLVKMARRHPQLAYAGLGMSLQLQWQYLQRTVPGVGNMMGPNEEALREKFFLRYPWGRRSTPN